MKTLRDTMPAFDHRRASYRLVLRDGRPCIAYRQPDDRPYPPEVIEVLAVIRDHPCEQLPRIHEIAPEQVVAEYLDGYVPLSKAGVTSTRFNLVGKEPRRFKRWCLRADQKEVARHFEPFIQQLQTLGDYFRERGLWHDDVIPQNVMWNRRLHRMKLIDICAFCPLSWVKDGRRAWYGHGRTRGVFDADCRVNRLYLREVFLQDLAP